MTYCYHRYVADLDGMDYCDRCGDCPDENAMEATKFNVTMDEVDLLSDGNAFAILGKVMRALRAAGATGDQIAAYQSEATKGDYDHLLATTMEWVNVE